jgi:hypothetical protein
MWSSFTLVILLFMSGWMVQRGNFCLVAAVNQAMNKRPERLLRIISIALISQPF